ncbi:MAG: extracellular solute-binding protein [Bacillota bacterium]
MKKNSMKVKALALACLMAMSLAGCGGSSDTSSSSSSSSDTSSDTSSDASSSAAEDTTSSAEESSSDEKITLRFVTWLSADQEQNERVAEAYEAMNPNIDVVFEYYGNADVNDYYTKVDLMILGNEPMDILVSGNYSAHSKRAESGAYYPLDDLLAAKGVEPETEFEFAPTVGGTRYALPYEWKSWLVMINKEMLDAAGLDVPSLDWTWDDYREYASAMTSGEGPSKKYGSLFVAWEQYNMLGMWSGMEHYPFIKEDGTPNYDDPLFKDWLEYRMLLENEDESQVPYSIVKSTGLNYRAEFFNGNVGMMPISTFILTELDDVSIYPHDFQTTFAPIPTWGDNEPGASLTEAVYYSVASASPHPEEALDFLYYYVGDGAEVKQSSISARAGADKMSYVETMIEDTQYVDMEALGNVLMNPEYKNRVYTEIPTYNGELLSMLTEEVEKYYFGQESDLDGIIDTMMVRGQQIIDENS